MRYMMIVAALTLAACVEKPESGAQLYEAECAGCHGADARGDGPYARGLETAPPDLTTIAARNGGVFPRDQVMSTIDGLQRDAHFSAAMPEFGAGDLGETVIVENNGLGTPVPTKLLLLTDYIELLQQ
ncbi:cytochrome c [Loktanella sp. D2R18]|uniref:c-type cytochrome n=1 Tax=Rhodobacterales TaxID=204455 RepID=UPI000DE847F5|nr:MULTISPECIES: cytochrome c [Rhodobacterales]MDO6589175.1 cytochrome c [Yoonia sp. 1_MG-2023]RBW45397.1 cytochrome c [Loktanella sp. D2R18]